jgi:hypothetical protein
MSFDWDGDVKGSSGAEKLTVGILQSGWRGARDVRNISDHHLPWDHEAFLPEFGRVVRIDTKAVKKTYPAIFWETRHEGIETPSWGTEERLDLIFYYMPTRCYVLDVAKARSLIDGHFVEMRLSQPTVRAERSWYTFGCVVPIERIRSALVADFGPPGPEPEEEPSGPEWET